MAELAQRTADEVGTEAGFQADHAGRNLLEGLNECQPLDFVRRKAIWPSAPNPTTWKTSLPISMPIEASGGVVVSMGCFSG
jgi:hypothetical protein